MICSADFIKVYAVASTISGCAAPAPYIPIGNQQPMMLRVDCQRPRDAVEVDFCRDLMNDPKNIGSSSSVPPTVKAPEVTAVKPVTTNTVSSPPPTIPPSPISSSPVVTSQPFVVAMQASVSGGARPIVTGTTNLPDGARLSIFLRMDDANLSDAAFSACGDICIGRGLSDGQEPMIRQMKSVVMNGQFSDGPITYKGAALPPGTYVLGVQLWASAAAGQPPNVLAVIGPLGENMTGPLVNTCCFAPGRREDKAFIQELKDLMRTRTSTTGALVNYDRYVAIGPN
jgi:hypothetical protein